jgi:hypothetical protein
LKPNSIQFSQIASGPLLISAKLNFFDLPDIIVTGITFSFQIIMNLNSNKEKK